MASIRLLKKDINYLTYDLVSECFVYQCFNPGAEEKKVEGAVESIIEKRNELIKRINNPGKFQSKADRKKFYKEIEEDAATLLDTMSMLNK